jgi:hypothetical protein
VGKLYEVRSRSQQAPFEQRVLATSHGGGAVLGCHGYLGAVLTTLFLAAFSEPARVFLFHVAYCQWGVGPGAQAKAAGAIGVLALAISLTFATDALGRRTLPLLLRVAWIGALLCTAPIALPAYWLLYLRAESPRE